jgi:hypothetical protein
MIRKSILLITLLFLIGFGALACGGDSVIVPAGHPIGIISGTVVDTATGKPAAGVKVQIKATPFLNDTTAWELPYVVFTSTDVNGAFIRQDIPSGDIRIKVAKDGYKTPDVQQWALSPGGTCNVTFEISPGQDPASKFQNDDGMEAWPPNFNPSK